MKVLILYSSLTGNTKKIAETFYESIEVEKSILPISEIQSIDLDEYELLCVGYWVDKGICDEKSKHIIESIENKKIVLFGTVGAMDNENYYDKIKQRVEVLIKSSNKIEGHFLCQGKINSKVTDRYKLMLEENPEDENLIRKIKNHTQAITHPDEMDIENANVFIKTMLNHSM